MAQWDLFLVEISATSLVNCGPIITNVGQIEHLITALRSPALFGLTELYNLDNIINFRAKDGVYEA